MTQLRSSIENSPIDMNLNDPKLAANLMDQSKSVVCLQCGIMIFGDLETHYNEKGHYMYLKGQGLVCKKCGHNFKPEELTEKVAEMLMDVGMAMMGKLPNNNSSLCSQQKQLAAFVSTCIFQYIKALIRGQCLASKIEYRSMADRKETKTISTVSSWP
eukprot:TRINITY_DN2757_c0_g1_i2.p1 TRINITY_DN2757_c0_g1~~TRINITY_DN2757_c0_g1_i2.p1  ORF type:complete len:158 (-),score=11.55 TRINITY_DN2757_c0_g1_i2:7-480(-)